MSKTLTKTLALVLALVMVLALAACGGTPATPATDAPATDEPTPVDVPETDEPTDEPEEPVEDEPVMPEYSFDNDGEYARVDDEDVYEWALGEYAELLADAESEDNTVDERFVKMAKAEAALLDSAVMIPNTTQNGAYTISRVAPRTVPYVQWGNDDDRLKGIVISDAFIDHAEREELIAAWKTAVAGGAAYDPAAILYPVMRLPVSEAAP